MADEKIGFTPPKKTPREPARTNLEKYLATTVQMLMARIDGRDEDPYTDKLDVLGELLTDEEIEFIDKMGDDWATHKWCKVCESVQPKSHECK